VLFTNINTKSHYSLLNSTLKVDDIIQHALVNGFKYASLCDDNYMGGALEFYFKCQKQDIIPIIGLNFMVCFDNNNQIKINAYALNNKGFKALEQISSYLYLNNLEITYQELIKYLDDLVILIDYAQKFYFNLFIYDKEALNDKLNSLKSYFNKYYYYLSDYNDSYYHYLEDNIAFNKEIIALDSTYHNSNDYYLLQILKAIAEQKEISKIDFKTKGTHFLLNKEHLVKYDQRLLLNTEEFISNFSNYDIIVDNGLPLYQKDLLACNKYLEKLSLLGLKKRISKELLNEQYFNRLEYELSIINKMGFANYFLIVYDYVFYAKKHDILVGPGRGSCAGSLVAYCLGITEVDPIKNNLIFERFLNPERINLPDIDVDFEDDRRYLIIEYLKAKYGHEYIAHICTYGTFQARSSIRDVGKVLKVPPHRINIILDLLPKHLNVSLQQIVHDNLELKLKLSTHHDLQNVFEIASKLEGINRHLSTHAAGVIINKNSLINTIPVMVDSDQTLLSQYSMEYLEKINLYKMDILGLRNLGVIRNIISYINDDINFYKIDINDQKTLKLLSSGMTLGIFQFESDGVMKVIKKMKIDSINDLVATTALFRPGPMQYIDEYIARKNEHKPFNYFSDDLKPILLETYGIIIYQEQIMQITQKLAGFSLAKADIVRKGMAKKDAQVLEGIKQEFISSSIKNGYQEPLVNDIYNVILSFAGYGFNKAHAYSYSLLAFYLAYFKANYPLAFFRSVLSTNVYNIDKLKKYFYEMKYLYNYKIVCPNINISTLEFEIVNDTFVLPFLSIKGLGINNAQLIMEERKNGLFEVFHISIIRLLSIGINMSIIEALILSGAFDGMDLNRTTMISCLPKIKYKYSFIDINQTNINFYSDGTNEITDINTAPKFQIYQDNIMEIANKEFALLGLYLDNHPLNSFEDKYPNSLLKDFHLNKQALVIIDSIKEIKTKKKELMAFVRVSDTLDVKTLVVFPRIYAKYRKILKIKNIMMVRGKLDLKDENNIIVDELIELIKKEDDVNEESYRD
jgi:DNA polymerase-3 subunit alpha